MGSIPSYLCEQTQSCYLTLLHTGALQLISSLVLYHHHHHESCISRPLQDTQVVSQLVSAHTRLDSSNQLCQACCGQLVFEREELCTHLSCKRAHFKTARGGSGPGGADSVHANAGGARDTENYQEQALNGFSGRSPMQSKAPASGTNSIQSYFPVQSLLHTSMRASQPPSRTSSCMWALKLVETEENLPEPLSQLVTRLIIAVQHWQDLPRMPG